MQLTPYKNLDGNSNIVGFYESDLFIVVKFASKTDTDSFYKYSDRIPGLVHVKELRELAHQGQGLNSYISKRKLAYEKKGRSLESIL